MYKKTPLFRKLHLAAFHSLRTEIDTINRNHPADLCHNPADIGVIQDFLLSHAAEFIKSCTIETAGKPEKIKIGHMIGTQNISAVIRDHFFVGYFDFIYDAGKVAYISEQQIIPKFFSKGIF